MVKVTDCKSISANLIKTDKDGLKFREKIKNLTKFDIAGDDGSLKSTFDIVKGIGKEFDNLNDQQKNSLAQDLFGKYQLNTGVAILSNYQKLDEVMKDLENSTGSVASEYNRFMDSTEAKVKQFKEEVSQIWTNLISSDLTRGIMDSVNWLIKTFGNGKTMLLGFATVLASVFKGKVGNDLLTSFTSLTKKIVKAKQEGELLSKTVNKIGKTQLILGGLTAGLMVFDIISSKIQENKEAIEEFNKTTTEGFSKTNEDITTAENLLKQKQDLESKINDNNNTTSQQVELKEQLLEVERKIAEILPESAKGQDAEGKAISENNDLIKEQIKLKQQQQTEDAKKVISNNGSAMFGMLEKDMSVTLKEAEAYKKTLDSIAKARDEGSSSFTGYNYATLFKTTKTRDYDLEEDKEYIDSYTKDFEEIMKKLQQDKIAVEQLKNNGVEKSEISDILGIDVGTFEDTMDMLTKSYEKKKEVSNEKVYGNTDDVKKFEEQIRTTKEIIGDLGDESGTRSQQIRELEQSLKGVFLDTFNGNETTIGSKIYDISYALNDLSRDGELSTQSISNLAKSLPDLDLANMSAEERVKALTEALKEQRNTAEQMSETSIKSAQATITNTVEMYSKITKYQEELKENGGN